MATHTEDPPQPAEGVFKETENQPHIDSDSDDGILSSYSLPTFPELTDSSKDQQSLLTRSQYAMVVFHGVADTYPTDSDIVCRYSLTDGVEAAPGDRVVLFAVGWSSIKDYVVFEWAPIPEKDERDLTVVFKAADLPKDVNEFYQVCYVSNESAVCGASVPFQVRTPHNDELTFALEEDMLVVRSSTAVAQDKLLKAQLDRENLNRKKLNLEKQLRSVEDKHSLTLQQMDKLQEENAHLLGINEQMSSMRKELEELQIKLNNAEQEKKKMEEDFEAKFSHVNHRRDHLEVYTRDTEDKLMETCIQADTLKEERDKLRSEIAIANEILQATEQSRASLSARNFSLDNELTVCKFNLNNAQVENLRLEAELEDLGKENEKLSEELKNIKQSQDKFNLNNAQVENLRLKAELEDLGKENEKLNEELKNIKQSQDTRESFYAQYSSTDKGRLIMNNAKLQRSMEDMQLMISKVEHEKSTLKQVLEDTLDAQKNNCSDHCVLEKHVAQLQYRLNEVSNKQDTIEKMPSSSHTDQSSSLANQVETLAKLLDDSLKENELRLQENMALRVQNEILELSVSKEKSKSEEYVIVSTCDSSRTDQRTWAIGSQPNEMERISELNAEIERLRQQFAAQKELADEYRYCLADKDSVIHDLNSEIDALKIEFLNMKEELKLEIANLVSKNVALVEQEIQSQELKNEMQKITFMNGELLVQNASLMDRIHDDNLKSFTNTDENVLQKTTSTQSNDKTFDIENEYLREQLKSTSEQLNTTRKQAETAIVQLHEYREKNDSLRKELGAVKKMNNLVESRYSTLTESSEMLLQRLVHLDTKVDEQCRHECCAEPKLKQIGQSVEHLLSAVEKLTNSTEVKEDVYSVSAEVDDLKYRLKLAQDEYEKLHTVMVNYRTKYNELKTKYFKKLEKSHHFSN